MAENKSYTKAEIAHLYGFSAKKFRSELKIMKFYEEFPDRIKGQILNIKQLDFIFEAIGKPKGFDE